MTTMTYMINTWDKTMLEKVRDIVNVELASRHTKESAQHKGKKVRPACQPTCHL